MLLFYDTTSISLLIIKQFRDCILLCSSDTFCSRAVISIWCSNDSESIIVILYSNCYYYYYYTVLCFGFVPYNSNSYRRIGCKINRIMWFHFNEMHIVLGFLSHSLSSIHQSLNVWTDVVETGYKIKFIVLIQCPRFDSTQIYFQIPPFLDLLKFCVNYNNRNHIDVYIFLHRVLSNTCLTCRRDGIVLTALQFIVTQFK